MMLRPFHQLDHVQDIIRQFTPNWFTVIMGTGIVALTLSEFPWFHSFFWHAGAVLWQLNTWLFLLFSLLYGLRWILFSTEAKQIFSHPMMCLFLAAIPMGLATIINGFLKYGQPLYGDITIQIAEYLWYADVIMALLIAWIVPFCMYRNQQHELKNMTAVWLLPIVACEVAASSGGLLLGHLVADQHAVHILLGSYVLWGISVLPAFAILTILMLRLALHQLPSKELAISSWLALGPIGTGALALLLLGHQAPRVLATMDLLAFGEFLQYAGLLASLILLGFALWWLGIAIMTTLHHQQKQLPFNLGWWGLTFPLGVLTLAILNLASQLDLGFIYAVGYAFATVLVLLWLMVVVKTAKGFYQGNLFFSPCLKTYLEKN